MTSDKTVREVLPPWHVLQERLQSKTVDRVDTLALVPSSPAACEVLACQEAANEHWMKPLGDPRLDDGKLRDPGLDDEAPSSGVHAMPPVPAWRAPGVESLLSFKVYTLAELERAPMRGNLENTVSRGRRWQRVVAALRAFSSAFLAWSKIRGARPDPRVALRKPFDVLGDELQVAVESIDWKKLGVRTGIVLGATLTLLFAVLTVAELTDDLKPSSGARLASLEPAAAGHPVAPALHLAATGVQPSALSPNALGQALPPARPAAAVSPAPALEIDDSPEPLVAHAKRPAGRKAAKPRSNKLTYRDADAVFNR